MVRSPLFKSPSKGSLDFDGMFEDLLSFTREDPTAVYNLIVGTDSQKHPGETRFVTAVVIHRIGKGARFYYQTQFERPMQSLRQKVLHETSLSLGLASRLTERLSQLGLGLNHVEIHLDIGQNGPTKETIKDLVGMIVGSGFDAKIKPDSFAASCVADKFTK